jgi:hypothetical protein
MGNSGQAMIIDCATKECNIIRVDYDVNAAAKEYSKFSNPDAIAKLLLGGET